MIKIPTVKYGEAYTEKSFSIHMVKGDFVTIELPKHESRMNRVDAGRYYTDKINNALGWNKLDPFARLDEVFREVRSETNKMIKNEVRKFNASA